MDNSTTISELKAKVKDFCDKRDWEQFHDAKELSLALSVEASELLEHFRWLRGDEISKKFEDKREDIEDELADIFYFILRIAQLNNIDLTKALERKQAKNDKKYPVEKVKGKHKKYDEY